MYKWFLDDSDPKYKYVENSGYMCKKVLRNPKTKRPNQHRGLEKTKKKCTETPSCMGIMKVTCGKRSKKLRLCEGTLIRTKKSHCVLRKEKGKHNLSFCVLCDEFNMF